MDHKQKLKFFEKFHDESEFMVFLLDLLRRIGFKNVEHTHQYGRVEYGKDIIGEFEHGLDGKEWYAFVVKQGKIKGDTKSIPDIITQVEQSFQYPYVNIKGDKIKIQKVRVVTNESFSSGAKDLISGNPRLKTYPGVDYWWNEKIVDYVDRYYSEFWLPGDVITKEYSKNIREKINNENEVKELRIAEISNEQLKRLIALYVKPHVTELKTLITPNKPKKIIINNVTLEDLSGGVDDYVIHGEPGAGKTRLLNKIMEKMIDPDVISSNKIYPVKLDLRDIKNNKFDIEKTIYDEIKKTIPNNFSEFDIKNSEKVILIDSVDDLFSEEIDILLENIKKEKKCKKCKFIITARSLDHIKTKRMFREVQVQTFNETQVASFVEKFFEGSAKGAGLIRSLKESNILKKLPTTPLALTLISLLYEENEYEIPATITDIYKDFTDVLLGKLNIKRKDELISLEIKKRMFAYIAYDMLEGKNFELKHDEFFSKIENYLSPRGIHINSISKFENFMDNSGIVYFNENRVGFKHLSFLEYFAAYHIHYVRNDLYTLLIEKFNDVNWQNAAIFYAGISKDMPWFIDKLVKELPGSELKDIMINSGGLGYLSQALYLTDVDYRVKLIEKALSELYKATSFFKKLTRDGGFFKDQPLNILTSVLSYWFSENFKSITLIQPLKKCFDNLISDKNIDLSAGNHEIGLKLLMLAITLSNKYLNEQEELNKLLDFECVSKDPILLVTLEMLLDISDIDSSRLDSNVKDKLRKEISRYKEVLRELTRDPAYRFDEDYKRTKNTIH